MFFDKKDLSFQILDVVEFRQGPASSVNVKRNFDGLSFRFSADTVITTEKGRHHVGDHAVCFFPAGVEYVRDTLHDELIAVHLRVNNYTAQDVEHFRAENPELLKRLFRDLLSRFRERRTGYEYECAALLNLILAECYRENVKLDPSHGLIEPSVRYLHEHFTEPTLTVSEVAACSHVSEVYFRKLFKKEFGVSPVKYLTRLRIRHAESLMSEGYHSLKEIAFLSGYRDYPYFSAEFKRILGVSPSLYQGGREK